MVRAIAPPIPSKAVRARIIFSSRSAPGRSFAIGAPGTAVSSPHGLRQANTSNSTRTLCLLSWVASRRRVVPGRGAVNQMDVNIRAGVLAVIL